MFATPIGYLIDEKGVIAADVAVGGDAILALASGPAPSAKGTASSRATGASLKGEEVTTMPG
jgi:hypothetical protein